MSTRNTEKKNGSLEAISEDLVSSIRDKSTDRRSFIKVAGLGVLGTASIYLMGCNTAEAVEAPEETTKKSNPFILDSLGKSKTLSHYGFPLANL